MPTASRSGSRRGSRSNWRSCVRSLSRPGPCARPRHHPLTGLVAALRALIRFHEAHPDWFPPKSGRAGTSRCHLNPECDPQLQWPTMPSRIAPAPHLIRVDSCQNLTAGKISKR